MGFLDKAKATATELASKAEASIGSATAGSGADRHLKDLGILAYAEAQGRPVDEDARARALGSLRDMEQQGRLGSLTLSGAPPVAPPPPGGWPAPPPPGAGSSGGPPSGPPPPGPSGPPPGPSGPPPAPSPDAPRAAPPPPPPPGFGS